MGLLQIVALQTELLRLIEKAKDMDGMISVEDALLQAIHAELEEHRGALVDKAVPNAIHFMRCEHLPEGLCIATSPEGMVLFFGPSKIVLEHEYPAGAKIHLSSRQYDLVQQKLAATKQGVAVNSD